MTIVRKKLIAVVSSPQEAIAIFYIRQKYDIDSVILCSLKNYADKGYINDVTLYILKKIPGIRIIKTELNLNYQISIIKPLEALRKLIFNYQEINYIDSKYFNNKLYASDTILAGNIFSPILERKKAATIEIVEHSPADARSQMYRDKGTSFNLNWNKIKYFFPKIIELINKSLIKLIFPNFKKLQFIKNGWSWSEFRPGHESMQYRDFDLALLGINPLEIDSIKFDKNSYALLLIDHPACYKNVEKIYQDLISISMEKKYGEMLLRDVPNNFGIVCKFHPYILDVMDSESLSEYKKSLELEFNRCGYKNIFYFDDLFSKPISNLPIEIFLKHLPFKYVLGIYASTFLLYWNWPNIIFISDCSFSKYFIDLRNNDEKIFRTNFKKY